MAKEQLYEMVVIFDAQGDETDVRREIDIVQSLVEKRSSEFLGAAEWGLRNLAYPIKKRTSGHYVYYLFKATLEVPILLANTLKINEKVLRHMIIRAKSNAPEYLAKIQDKIAQTETAIEAEKTSIPEEKDIIQEKRENEIPEETETTIEEPETITEEEKSAEEITENNNLSVDTDEEVQDENEVSDENETLSDDEKSSSEND